MLPGASAPDPLTPLTPDRTMSYMNSKLTLAEARAALASLTPFAENGGNIAEDWHTPCGEYG